jgi:mannitol-1-/sugar-/sorbitol-6-phosphatase
MTELNCRAILFDLDGVLVDSRAAVEEVWRIWAGERGRNPEPFIRVAHGRRISETLRQVAPELDIGRETAALDALEATVTTGIVSVPGARELVALIPPDRMGIVTSGSARIARLRLSLVGIPVPQVFITAEQVKVGKPDPQGYLAGAAALKQAPSDCLVFEDAPPGVAAARAAGMCVVGVLTTQAAAALSAAEHLVPDLTHISLRSTGGGLVVSVRDARL